MRSKAVVPRSTITRGSDVVPCNIYSAGSYHRQHLHCHFHSHRRCCSGGLCFVIAMVIVIAITIAA
ncbi:hypothetical protein GQ55_8G125300 [Panicum hallii var. hallii]|uniref:Uncharacterized protein n=1 Tax=Panicum hallii var. hallii TaxID=1504633 RepID=A0A2T7CMW3_9POAL|nr:hypothetical protein GQ55_8G125300 [Panicum hallii var. hallii]